MRACWQVDNSPHSNVQTSLMYLKEPKYYLLHFRNGEIEAGYDTGSHSERISDRAETKSHSVLQPQEKCRVIWRRRWKEGRNSTNESQDIVFCIIAVIRSFCHCQAPKCGKLLSQQDSIMGCQVWSNLKRPLGKEHGWHVGCSCCERGGGQSSGKGGKQNLSSLSCLRQKDDQTGYCYVVSGFVPSNLNRLILV